MHQALPASLPEIPPIVLMVDDDPNTLELNSAYFESSGLWVATSSAPAEALDAVQELKPDAIVTEVGFHGEPLGVELVHALKSAESTKGIPIVVLSGSPATELPAPTRAEADLCLIKPVLPDNLLQNVRRLIVDSHQLRERSDRAGAKTAELVNRSERLLTLAAQMADRGSAPVRTCPECATPLEWIEQGQIGGVTYDYYRWCTSGCGLYCYDRDASHWVKLA
jgi:CheY-like chemotaxis protein